MDSSAEQVDWSRVYGALADDRRRAILLHLTQTGDPIAFDDAVHHFGSGATDGQTDARRAALSSRVYHIDLPQLASAGLIDWDTTDDTIAPTPLLAHLPVGMLSPEVPGWYTRGATGKASD